MKCYLVQMVGVDDKLINFDIVAEIKGRGERITAGHVATIDAMIKQCYGASGTHKVGDKTYVVHTTLWAESQKKLLETYPAKDYYQYAVETYKKGEQYAGSK